jgi:hypothetical protein
MQEYFGSFTILIFTIGDFDFPTAVEIVSDEGGLSSNLKNYINILKEKKDWSSFDIVFFDVGGGTLIVLKDNTSKFSVPEYQIQNVSK